MHPDETADCSVTHTDGIGGCSVATRPSEHVDAPESAIGKKNSSPLDFFGECALPYSHVPKSLFTSKSSEGCGRQ